MHFLMFQMKRAHLRSLAAARPFSLRVDLTPARYDFLHAIAAHAIERHQCMLWRTLGVSRTSASKMVRRLIDLGLLQRRRSPIDGRTFLVSLTDEGMKRWRRTFVGLRKKRPFQRRFERAFGERSWKTSRAVDRLSDTLTRVARHLGDRAWDLYRTKPFSTYRPRRPRPTGAMMPATTPSRPARAARRHSG